MANRSTLTINTKTAEGLLNEIEAMRKSLEALRKKIVDILPAKYGSDIWWDREIKEGLKEVKQGKYTVYKNAKDLIHDLHAGV